MVDDVTITEGVGTDIAADDIANVYFQRIKFVLGVDGVNDGDVAISNPVPVINTSALLEGGLTELIGINEQVDTDEYGASIGVALAATYSGEILNIALYTTEDGTGQILTPAGLLMILDADPATTAGDTSITAGERVTVLGQVVVEAANWREDANGASVYIYNQPVSFHALGTLYFLWFHEDATSFNDAGGDDEQMEMNFWFRRDS